MSGATKLTLTGLPKGVVSSTLSLSESEQEGTLTLSTLPDIKPADVAVAHLVQGDAAANGDAGSPESHDAAGVTVSVATPDAGNVDETLHFQAVAYPKDTTVGWTAVVSATPDYGFIYGHMAFEGDFSSLAGVIDPVPSGHSNILIIAHHFLTPPSVEWIAGA